jgi:hypothetical protein
MCVTGVKDASDKKILVDMLLWAVDNLAPANFMLISGDRDFSNALHQLRMRRYNILLAQPQKASVPLIAAAKTLWLWTSLSAGGPPLSSGESSQFANGCLTSNHETSQYPVSEPIQLSQPVTAGNSENLSFGNQRPPSAGRVGGDKKRKGKHTRKSTNELSISRASSAMQLYGGDSPPPPPPPPPSPPPLPPPPPPQMPDLAQFWATFTKFMTTITTAMPGKGEHYNTVGCSSANFMHNSPMFDGSEEPLAADNWISTFEDFADALRCTDDQKVDYVGMKLNGEAQYWWKARKTVLTEELGRGVPILWEHFKKEFNDRFLTRAQRQQCVRDFQDLKQGNMTVEQYSTEFQKLLRYAPHLIPDEETKAEKFRDGLSPQIRERIIFLKVTDYVEMVHIAIMAEKETREVAADYVNRKRSLSLGTPSPPPPSKRQSFSSDSEPLGSQGAPVSQNNFSVTECSKCGRKHPGPCRLGVCFGCGKPGHHVRNCPTVAAKSQGTQVSNNQPRPTAKARVYMLTPENVKAYENVANVATGIILLFRSIACIWFY